MRCDPPIAPDEPVAIVLRRFDTKPGCYDDDIKFVYKHALTTVHEVKRQMAKRVKHPQEALDLVMGGRRLADDKTLRECGVNVGYVVYLRVVGTCTYRCLCLWSGAWPPTGLGSITRQTDRLL